MSWSLGHPEQVYSTDATSLISPSSTHTGGVPRVLTYKGFTSTSLTHIAHGLLELQSFITLASACSLISRYLTPSVWPSSPSLAASAASVRAFRCTRALLAAK